MPELFLTSTVMVALQYLTWLQMFNPLTPEWTYMCTPIYGVHFAMKMAPKGSLLAQCHCIYLTWSCFSITAILGKLQVVFIEVWLLVDLEMTSSYTDMDEVHHIIFKAPEDSDNLCNTFYKESSCYSSRDSIQARSSWFIPECWARSKLFIEFNVCLFWPTRSGILQQHKDKERNSMKYNEVPGVYNRAISRLRLKREPARNVFLHACENVHNFI